jgi:molybdopterin-containing oxidoreductase family membrane subunit
MTLFALACALVYPIIHLGRAWLVHTMLPVPSHRALWPRFESPLVWDVFAIAAYGAASLAFWYMGLVPDLATVRDRACTRTRRLVYGLLALGWRGSARGWLHHERSYLVMAGLVTALVISVHTIVALSFAISLVPGWHSTILPVYFVAGAVLSGLAMVVILMAACRRMFGLEQLVTVRHFDGMAKIMLLAATMVGYAHLVELLLATYGGNPYEHHALVSRALGDHAWTYWLMLGGTVVVPQLLWLGVLRTNLAAVLAISIFVCVGMWLERLVIVVASLHRGFVPASWGAYAPTFWDVASVLGGFGLFFLLFGLFVRYVPMVALAELKTPMVAGAVPPEPSEDAE